ncbi:MAG TPA: DUF1269 domain-containing protein [Chloroflexota bacterium]|nr:DUF1269 domain-containing protein [Chloroflexota bacterium]HUM68887.1 DUF1269 domain-containing protein [Chloroflexota bacterium]
MPSELSNQTGRAGSATGVGAQMQEGAISRLIVVTFADSAQAEGLYEALVALDKQKVVNLEDAVFVSRNAEGKLAVDERVHNEKRSGTVKGAVLGTLIGFMLGGPVLGLAGGAVVGRLIGKRMDLGIDEGTIQSVSAAVDEGQTALFIMGSARHAPSVVEAFRKFHGTIIETTVEPDARARLQRALDEENEE